MQRYHNEKEQPHAYINTKYVPRLVNVTLFPSRISQRVAKMNVTKRMSTNLQQVALDGQVSMDQAQWP